jgi:hypothetical protein
LTEALLHFAILATLFQSLEVLAHEGSAIRIGYHDSPKASQIDRRIERLAAVQCSGHMQIQHRAETFFAAAAIIPVAAILPAYTEMSESYIRLRHLPLDFLNS